MNPVIIDFNLRHFIPLKVFKVKSRTNFNPDLGRYEEYEVGLWEDERLTCNCLSGGFNKPCWHKKEILIQLEKEFGSVNAAVRYYRKIK